MQITALDFIHPEDKAALENLQSVPLLSDCLKMLMKIGVEESLHGTNMSNKIRLGPDQLPKIYNLLPPICAKLGIAVPDFYLEMDPQPNAYTMGDSRVFLTVTSGLLEYLEEDEICAVLAHECGHIVCHHVLYHTLAHYLVSGAGSILGLTAPVLAAPVVMPLQIALAHWSRRSEFSADRAAAVVMGDPRSVVDTMIRLSGGSKTITGSVNLKAYLKQTEAYDTLRESKWDQFLQSMAVMNEDHPFPAVRAREITRWCESDSFQRMQRHIHDEATAPKCIKCGALLQKDWKFCQQCGQPHV